MNITIHSTGLTATSALKQSALDKFNRLERLLDRYRQADPVLAVELSRTTHHHHKGKIFRAEAHLTLGKKSLYAATEADDLLDSMDHCVASIKKQLVRLKERT